MTSSAQHRLDELTELGLHNREVIRLVVNHCRHARVEKSPLMGQGMAEATSGLPIDGREINCPHAANGSMAGMDLEGIAVDFFRRNCVGCEHRSPVGLPNLKGFVEQLDEERERAERAEQEREARLDEQRQQRARDRRERTTDEPEPTRDFVALLDGVDSAAPDARADELLILARAAPELCTPVVAELLLETAKAVASDQLVEAIAHLRRKERITDDAALEVALHTLAEHGRLKVAAELMVELRDRVTAANVVPAIPALLALAGPHSWLGPRPKGYDEGLAVAAAVALPAVLDELLSQLGSGEERRCASAAEAAAILLEAEPAAASLLVRPLVAALATSSRREFHAGSPHGPIQRALRAALTADPAATAATLVELGAELDEDRNGSLVRVFDGVVRGRRDEALEPAVVEEAISACLKIADGRWGERSAGDAADALELFAKHEPDALLPHADTLLGILMTTAAEPIKPEPLPGMEWLAKASASAVRSGRLTKLTDAIGALVRHGPDALRDPVLAVLDADDPGGEEALTLRRRLIELLAALAERPEGLADALPRLYSALLHGDAGVRAAGIKAWRELARASGFVAPAELEDLLPALLADRYVAVHRAMVSALLFGLPVSPRHRAVVLRTLLELAEYYASEDGYFLDDVLNVAWRLSRHFDASIAAAVQRRLLILAAHLASRYELEQLLTGLAREVRGPEMTDRLIEAIARAADEPDDREADGVLRLLREQPPALLADRVDPIRAAARRYLPLWSSEALKLVEVLQVAGCNDEAVALTEEVVAAVPDTTADAARRLVASITADAAHLELSLASATTDEAGSWLAGWRRHEDDLSEIRAAEKPPWGFDE